jgi:hypothetical protein
MIEHSAKLTAHSQQSHLKDYIGSVEVILNLRFFFKKDSPR